MKNKSFMITTLSLVLVLILAACRSDTPDRAAPSSTDAGDPVAGEKIYANACLTCHGSGGQGIPGRTKDMTQSELIATKTDQELVEFIKLGGVPGGRLVMLPRGGKSALTDENLYDIVASYLCRQIEIAALICGKSRFREASMPRLGQVVAPGQPDPGA